MDKLVLIEKILRLLICVMVLVSLFIFVSQVITVDRWQERAINNYNAAILSNQKPPHQLENWWSQSPIYVGFSVWLFDINNLISIFVGFLFSGIKLLLFKPFIFKYFHSSK